MRVHQVTAIDVRDGQVMCPVTNWVEDVETCLSCARLAEVERDASGDAPQVVRCRLEKFWRSIPAAFMS